MDYLVEEIFQQQPEPVQLSCCTPGFLSACAARCAMRSCARRLTSSPAQADEARRPGRWKISNRPICSSYLDNERNWYRYHQLFADLLRKRLMQQEQSLASQQGDARD